MTNLSISRRTFVKSSALATGAAVVGALPHSRAAGANDRIRIGVIGVGGMGTGHVGINAPVRIWRWKLACHSGLPWLCSRKGVHASEAG